MKIAELKVGMNNVDIEAVVIEKSEVRTVQTKYGFREVCDFLIQDETGKIYLTLWEKNIQKIKVGDRIKIEKAFVSQFKNKKCNYKDILQK
jgi:replication factor A1